MYDEIEDNEYNGNSWDYDDLDNWGQQESFEDANWEQPHLPSKTRDVIIIL